MMDSTSTVHPPTSGVVGGSPEVPPTTSKTRSRTSEARQRTFEVRKGALTVPTRTVGSRPLPSKPTRPAPPALLRDA